MSWGLLLPMGAIFARYLKTFKSADPAWFCLHVACQLIGYGVGASGFTTGINLGNMSKGITYSVHRNIGIAVFALGTLQVHTPCSSHDTCYLLKFESSANSFYVHLLLPFRSLRSS